MKVVDPKKVVDYGLRSDGNYNVWKEFDLLELGEITNKTAKKVYLKFKIDIPKRWCIVQVVNNPSEWKENAT